MKIKRILYLLSILIILGSVILPGYSFSTENEYSKSALQKMFEEAMILLDSRRYKEAVAQFEKIIAAEKTQKISYFSPYAEVYIEKLQAKMKEKDYEIELAIKLSMETLKKPVSNLPSEIRKTNVSFTANELNKEQSAETMPKKEEVEKIKAAGLSPQTTGAKKIVLKEENMQKENRPLGKITGDIIRKVTKGPSNKGMISAMPSIDSMASSAVIVNDVILMIDGENIILPCPLRRLNDKLWLPLDAIADKTGIMVIEVGLNKFNVIQNNGVPLAIEAGKKNIMMNEQLMGELVDPPWVIDKHVMVSIASLERLIDRSVRYDSGSQTVYIEKKSPLVRFSVTNIPRPKKEPFPAVPKTIAAKTHALPRIKKTIPYEAQPDVALTSVISSGFQYLRSGRSTVDINLNVNGKLYDYSMFSGYLWKKDENDSTKYLGGYIDLSRPTLHIKLLSNSVKLDSLRTQSENIRGIQVTKSFEKYEITAIGGATENNISGNTGSVKFLGELYGIQQTFRPNNAIEIKGDIFRMENEPEYSYESGTTAFPLYNTVLLTSAKMQLPSDMSIFGKYANCDYLPENRVVSKIQDKNFAGGFEIDKKWYDFNYTYEFVGKKFVSIGNPSSYQDFKGWTASHDLHIFDNLFIGASYQQYHNNVEDDSSLPTTENDVLSLRSSFLLTGNKSITTSWLRSKSETTQVNTETSGDTNDVYRIDFHSSWRNGSWLLTYEHMQTDSLIGSSDKVSNMVAANLFRFFQNKSYLSFRQELREEKAESAVDKERQYNTDATYNYYFTSGVRGYLNTGLNFTKGPLSQDDKSTGSLRVGVDSKLNNDTSFNVEYKINNYDFKVASAPLDWSILFRYWHSFSIATAPNWGKIEGRVFEDVNGNGVAEEGEKGVADMGVYLDSGEGAVSDENGFFSFPEVAPGVHTVQIDLAQIPIDFASKSVAGKETVTISAKRVTNAYFSLIRFGTIQGAVFIDYNGNGAYDQEEDGISDVVIQLEPGNIETKTDINGYYTFSYLLPGYYTITCNTKAIPFGHQLISSPINIVEMSVGGDITDINFSVAPKPVTLETFPAQ